MINITHPGWTTPETELLTQLHKEGLSFALIANQIPGKTRNSCIGKAHRLGLKSEVVKMQKPRARGKSKNPRKTAKPRPAATRPASAPDIVELTPPPFIKIDGNPVLSLREGECKWPIGEPKDDDFHFCMADTPYAKPYCEYHRKIGTEPRRGNRKRKKAVMTWRRA